VQTRQLSTTGLFLSVKGLGTWPFGGDGWAGSWGPQPAQDCADALRVAVEHGVNWVDTAPAYGGVLVATKCGERIGPDGTYRSGDPHGVREDCDASLKRLRREVIDLYQLHHAPPDVPIEETWQAMHELVTAGKVRHIGLCNVTVEQLRRCHAIAPVASYQGPYSPLRRRMEDEILPYCRAEGIGVLPFGALGHGFLARTRDRSQFADGDWRTAPRWAEEFGRGQDLVADLRAATGDAVPVGTLSAHWLVGRAGVVATPIGARSGEQARETFGGPDVEHLAAAVAEVVERHRTA
jgi:aryl-alcohol dehydrogenase-like predicted oxidoreductase